MLMKSSDQYLVTLRSMNDCKQTDKGLPPRSGSCTGTLRPVRVSARVWAGLMPGQQGWSCASSSFFALSTVTFCMFKCKRLGGNSRTWMELFLQRVSLLNKKSSGRHSEPIWKYLMSTGPEEVTASYQRAGRDSPHRLPDLGLPRCGQPLGPWEERRDSH